MKRLYSKFVETKVTQYFLSHKLVQKVGKLSSLPGNKAQFWKQPVLAYPQQGVAFWAR